MKNSNQLSFNYPDSNKKSEIMNYFDISNWLVEESNSKLDKSSMLNSIEARVPLQDKCLIQKYFDVSLNVKIDLFNLKKLLKKLKFIPDYIIKRKKQGWFSPESIFLRSYLKSYFDEMFEKENIANQKIFNHEKLYEMFEKHNNGSYYKKELITIFTFQIWYDQIINLD